MTQWFILTPYNTWLVSEDQLAPKQPRIDHSLTPPNFIEERKISGGARNDGLFIGKMGGAKVMRKVVNVQDIKGGEGYVEGFNARGGGKEGYLSPFVRQYRYIMNTCERKKCENIIRVYGARQLEGSKQVELFTKKYPQDAYKFTENAWKTVQDVANMFHGAWNGLHELHTKLKMVHGDLSLRNIFVDEEGRGFIADLDHVLYIGDEEVGLQKCDPKVHTTWGTMCLGAPFPHCDPRRDQVSLLMNTFGMLLQRIEPEIPAWSEFCIPFLTDANLVEPNEKMDPESMQGYEVDSKGEIVINADVYLRYIEHVLEILPAYKNNKALTAYQKAIEPLFEYIRLLYEIIKERATEAVWEYQVLHDTVTEALQTLSKPVF